MPCEVIESRVWKHLPTGRTASPYGVAPWLGEADRSNWELQVRGFTVRNPDGTIGCGRPPCVTREEAQALADHLNALGFRGMMQD